MSDNPEGVKTTKVPDEDTRYSATQKQLFYWGKIVLGLLLGLGAGYTIYLTTIHRVSNLEDEMEEFADVIRKELPSIVKDAVEQELDRENVIFSMLKDYTCDELASHQRDIVRIQEIKKCPK